ncbi:hypothetical protein CVAR21S_01247 [Corynebacterium variabile]
MNFFNGMKVYLQTLYQNFFKTITTNNKMGIKKTSQNQKPWEVARVVSSYYIISKLF